MLPPFVILKVDLNGDYNRDGNPVDHANEADAVTFAGPKGYALVANNDDDNGNDEGDAWEEVIQDPPQSPKISGTADLADISIAKIEKIGIPSSSMPSTWTLQVSARDPASGDPVAGVVALYWQPTSSSVGFQTGFVLNNAQVKAYLAGSGTVDLGIEGCAYGEQALVRLELLDGTSVLCSDEIRVLVAPYFVSPNTHPADEVFVSFTGDSSVLTAFTAGLSGISPLRKSSDYPVGTGSVSMRYIQDHVEFGYTRTAVGQSTYKSSQVILGLHGAEPTLLDLIDNDRAFYWEGAPVLYEFGDLLFAPPTSARPYGTVVCGKNCAYKDFLKRQKVQPESGNVVEIDDTWLATPHADTLVAFVPVSGGYKVFVADLQLAMSLLAANPGVEVESLPDLRAQYSDPANATTIAAINAKLSSLYDDLEAGLGVPKSQFIHVPVALNVTDVMGLIRPWLPILVNMQYVTSGGGERVFVPKAHFAPFWTDGTDGLKAKLNGIGITDAEIQVVPTASSGFSPFHEGNGGDAHCISNPSMEAPASP